MKKILFSILVVIVLVSAIYSAGVPTYSNTAIFQSSFTKTNETGKAISGARWVHSIIVSSTTTGGVIYLYDSIGSTTTGNFGVVDLGSLNAYPYDLWLSSGFTYTTSGNANGVTIMYKK